MTITVKAHFSKTMLVCQFTQKYVKTLQLDTNVHKSKKCNVW